MLHCCESKFDSQSRRLADAYAAQSRVVRARVEAAAEQAKERLVPLAETAALRARPVVDSAIAKVADIVTTDIKPHLAELREQAAPIIADASKRGHLAAAALAGVAPVVVEPVVAKRRRHPILKFLGIAALLAVIGLLVRAILDSRDDSWEKDDIFDDDHDDVPAEEIIVVEEPLQGVIPMDEPPADPLRYGPDSFIGQEPPAGFDIKANERSMKYHVPTAIGYQRCVTDIWFNSPEAAERAGFTRALR